jgi:hypothetical protein
MNIYEVSYPIIKNIIENNFLSRILQTMEKYLADIWLLEIFVRVLLSVIKISGIAGSASNTGISVLPDFFLVPKY